MWLFLLQPDVGVLANVEWISDLFPVLKSPGLLRDPGTALISVVATSIWTSLGFTFILITAGLQGIPPRTRPTVLTKRPCPRVIPRRPHRDRYSAAAPGGRSG